MLAFAPTKLVNKYSTLLLLFVIWWNRLQKTFIESSSFTEFTKFKELKLLASGGKSSFGICIHENVVMTFSHINFNDFHSKFCRLSDTFEQATCWVKRRPTASSTRMQPTLRSSKKVCSKKSKNATNWK